MEDIMCWMNHIRSEEGAVDPVFLPTLTAVLGAILVVLLYRFVDESEVSALYFAIRIGKLIWAAVVLIWSVWLQFDLVLGFTRGGHIDDC